MLILVWNRVWFSRKLRECMNVFMVLIPHDELITLTMKVATQTPHPVFQAPRAFRAVWHQPESGLDRQFSTSHVGISDEFNNLFPLQCCQLSWIIRQTPDFGPYLPVSRLESYISPIIAKVAISCRLDFPTIKFQIFCFV